LDINLAVLDDRKRNLGDPIISYWRFIPPAAVYSRKLVSLTKLTAISAFALSGVKELYGTEKALRGQISDTLKRFVD
jgi:hypothetical protein